MRRQMMASKRIKIWIVILAALTAAALVYTFTGASSIRATADRVEYVQKTVYGDPSAAEGISAVFTNDAYGAGVVRWTTRLGVSGGRDEVSVSHQFLSDADNHSGNPYMDEIGLYTDIESIPGIDELARKTAEELSPGGSREIRVRVSDYAEYLPITAQYAVGTRGFQSRTSFNAETKQDEPTNRVDAVLGELFKIKVSEDLTAVIEVSRYADKDGELNYGFYVSVYEGDYPSFTFPGFIEGRYYYGAFYIYRYNGSSLDRRVDLEPLPDGTSPYRIYRLPVKYKEASGQYGPWYELDIDNISVVGDVGKDFRDLESELLKDGSGAMILGKSDGRLKAVIADFRDGGSLQILDLCEEAEDYHILFKDDWFALEVLGKGYYVVYPQGGSYAVFFAPTDGSVEEAESRRYQYYWNYIPYDVSYKDGRLAVACFAGDVVENTVNGQTNRGYSWNGISLAVYTEEGLRYYTRYTSTLFQLQYLMIYESQCSTEVSQ